MGNQTKMTKCKKCGAEIASIAVICPSCGCKNKKPIYKRVWLWVVVFFVIVAIIGSSGSENSNTTNPTSASSVGNSATSEKVVAPNTPFDGDCGIVASGDMGTNIIGQPSLTLSVKNTTDKEIKALCFYCIPYNVYGEEVQGIFVQNKLTSDQTISAGKTTKMTWDLLEDDVKTVKLYVYSVYFADGTEWGNKDATRSSAIKNGCLIEVDGEA